MRCHNRLKSFSHIMNNRIGRPLHLGKSLFHSLHCPVKNSFKQFFFAVKKVKDIGLSHPRRFGYLRRCRFIKT